MLFNSMAFIWFLVVVLTLYYILPKTYTKYLILTASYVFYGWWNYKFLGLIFFSTLVNYSVAILCDQQTREKGRKYLLLFSVIFNIGLLGIFKYFNFFSESLAEILSFIGFQRNYVSMNIILPLGISFLSFQTMSYTIDVYNKKLSPEKDFIVFAAFIAFFPKVVSGPIERAGDLIPQLRQKQPIRRGYLSEGVWLMLLGYFLKVFMADNLGALVDSIYSNYKTISGADVVICNYVYAFQIFGDFAGYSYMAIGVARLFGIALNDNFRFPYFVKTPSEFWKNWHISLSTWLRDYLYIPLGGSRRSRILTHRNLLITMTLAGLWHGAAWPFVLWGIYQGIMLISFKVISEKVNTDSTTLLKSAMQIFIMFNITCAGWMIFRTPNMEVFNAMTNHLIFDFSKITYRTFYWGISFLFFVSVPFTIHLFQFINKKSLSIPFKTSISRVSCCMIMIFLLLGMGNWGTSKFIYLQF